MWFFPIVLPALILAAVLLTLMAFCYHRKWLNKITFPAAVFLFVALECLGIETILSRYGLGHIAYAWSPYVAAPCIFIALVFFYINGNRAVREEFRRRAHF